MKLSEHTIRLIAGHWNKDVRTVRRWMKKKGATHPMITHPETQVIINKHEILNHK